MLKAAVCFSGIPVENSDVIKVIENQRKYLPYDCFFHTWKEYKKYFGNLDINVSELPDLEVIKENINKAQFFNHHLCMQYVPEEYNVIVRTKYKLLFTGSIDIEKHVKEVYETGITIGLSELEDKKYLNMESKYGSGQGFGICDVIIHKREHWLDPYKVSKKQILLSNEDGWYQLLNKDVKNIMLTNIKHFDETDPKIQRYGVGYE